MSFVLRPYQASGVSDLRAVYAAGRRAPLFVLPTGGGKTAIFSHIAQSSTARGRGSLILVHRMELLSQASASLQRLNVDHGIVSPRYMMSSHLCQIGSVQTVVRRLDKILRPDLIIIDEAHHATSATYRKILSAFSNAHILGVTATPIRSDGNGLGVNSGGIFDELVLGPSTAKLISDGFLVKPKIFAPPIGVDISDVKKIAGDFDKRELNIRIDKPTITGSAVEHYIKHAKGEPALAFCVRVSHAEHVAAEFRTDEIRAVHVDGGMSDFTRRKNLEDFAKGEIDVVTSADLIGEGVDIPRCSVIISLRPTYSKSLWWQQCGRALRPYPGKSRALILDHVGNTFRHGFIDDDENNRWELDAEIRRKREKFSDGENIRISQCEVCFYVYESGPEKCPQCGHVSESKKHQIKQTDGELAELQSDQLQKKIASRIEQGSARTLEDLIQIGITRGYKNPRFWAEKVLSGRRR